MNKPVYKIIISVLLSVLIFTSCGQQNKGLNADKVSATNVNINSERGTFENTINSYYKNEVSKDSTFLSKYFLNSKMASVEDVKKMLKAYKVSKMKLIKLYNVKTNGNYVVATSAYNTFFEGISDPCPNIEVIALKKKNNVWYIINDYSDISENDAKWLKDTAMNEKQQIGTNADLQDILQKNDGFTKKNQAFFDNAQKILQEN